MWRLAFILAVMLAGCANDELLRKQAEPCELTPSDAGRGSAQCPQSHLLYERAPQSQSTEKGSSSASGQAKLYELGVIEFDDQGLFRDRNQLSTTLGMLEQHGDEGNVDVVLFIHGWHHTAMAEDSNLQSFQVLLRRLALRSPSRKIVGVYVGWRGENYPFPLTRIPMLSDSNFWDRKNVSIEVGRGALYELIERLRLKTDAMEKSRLISIGHSFGASVLLSVSKNEVYRDLIQDGAKKDCPDAAELKSLTILINPAIEAIHFLPLYEVPEEIARIDLARKQSGEKVCASGRYGSPATPRIAVFMSEADGATKYAFRAGRILSTLLESHQVVERTNRNGLKVPYSEFEMDTQALGHYEYFVTHKLASTIKDRQLAPGSCNAKQISWSDRLINPTVGEGWEVDFKASDTRLTHLKNSPPFSPVWVVKVDADIVPDHNQIWDRGLDCFVEELVLTGVSEQSRRKPTN